MLTNRQMQSRKIYKQDLTLEVGYVYVMTNEHMPNLVKIGMTTRTPTKPAKALNLGSLLNL